MKTINSVQQNIEVEVPSKRRLPTWEEVAGKVGQTWREKIRPHISYRRHPLAFTLIAMALIFAAAVAADQIQARHSLSRAMANPQNLTEFTQMLGQRIATTGTVVENRDGDQMIVFCSPAAPCVYDAMWYLNYFGTAKTGDKITFIWMDRRSPSCPAVYQSGEWYLVACGLKPLGINQ